MMSSFSIIAKDFTTDLSGFRRIMSSLAMPYFTEKPKTDINRERPIRGVYDEVVDLGEIDVVHDLRPRLPPISIMVQQEARIQRSLAREMDADKSTK